MFHRNGQITNGGIIRENNINETNSLMIKSKVHAGINGIHSFLYR